MSALRRTFAFLTLAGLSLALTGCVEEALGPDASNEVRTEPAAEETFVRYVNAASGTDELSDGRTPTTAYRTIGRALRDVPSVVGSGWTIRIAPGTYPETVRLDRFVMPSDVSYSQLVEGMPSVYLSLTGEGDSLNQTIIAPPQGSPCLNGSSVALFLQNLSCHAREAAGLILAGSSLILDDVAFGSYGASQSAVALDRSSLFLGGSLRVESLDGGRFTTGLSIRSFSVARSGTYLNPRLLNARFSDVQRAMFLRDYGVYTTTYSTDTYHFERVDNIAVLQFKSTLFLTSTAQVVGRDIGTAFRAQHESKVNVHAPHLTNVGALYYCSGQSGIALENGTYENLGSPGAASETCVIAH